MDSMKSLNSSLPRQSQQKSAAQKPEDLLQVFKNAALSVTNLYRTAEANDSRARQAGYQDALDELLSFLDKENLGVGDGEGWNIRQWATERLDDQPGFRAGSESEEDKPEHVAQTKETPPASHSPSNIVVSEQVRLVSEPTQTLKEPPILSTAAVNTSTPQPEAFTFRSAHALPSPDTEMQSPEVAKLGLSQPDAMIQSQSPPAVTVNVLPRGSRTPRSNRHGQRTASTRNLGSGAGSKRKVAFADFFDVGSFEGPGSGKRGRLS